MNYVIGSGPAGMLCAWALLKRGQPVTMLDAGNDLEPERKEQIVQLRAASSSSWTRQSTAFLRANVAPDRKGVGLKYAYGSDYPYRDVARFTPIEREGVDLTASLASGGFSTVWGAAMLPYTQHDLGDWPITQADLAPHYSAVLSTIGYSATTDDLQEHWPVYHDNPRPLQSSRQAQSLLQRVAGSRDRLRTSGLCVGASRLAVRPQPCVYCGLCMYGCPHELIFNAAQMLPELKRLGQFNYVPGVIVQRIEETASSSSVHAIDKQTGGTIQFKADRVYLGAGVLNTSRIVLQSLKAFDHPLRVSDSCYFLAPWLRWRGQRGVSREPLHTLAQLFIEILDPQVSAHWVHLQLYTYNDLYVGAMRKMLGPAYTLMRPFVDAGLSRLHILQGYLHSTESPQIELRLIDGKLKLRAIVEGAAADYRNRIHAVLNKLKRHRKDLGGFPVARMLHVPAPGRGFHSGGSLPMRTNPGPFETDTAGRPTGFSRLHLIDSSTFPTIPATTITLTVMANAHRIGSMHL